MSTQEDEKAFSILEEAVYRAQGLLEKNTIFSTIFNVTK